MVPFVYVASVCQSLQCLISALTQAGGGGLIQVAGSIALRGGAGAAFPVYAAQAPGRSIWSGPCIACSSSFRVFHKSTDSVGPEFSSGSQELDGRTLRGCMSLVSVRAPVGCMRLVSVLGSWPLAVTLPEDVDHPESQEVFG